MGRPFRILAIEGGGIRGLIPALLMAEFERRTAQLFDLIAGASTGGLLALGAAQPAGGRPRYSAEEMAQLYELEGPRIFLPRPVAHPQHGGRPHR